MAILTFYNLRLSFAEVDIFSGLAASIPHKARIGLVGPNGVGKTSLLRLLAGVTSPSEGAVHLAKKTQLGYLRQEAERAFANTEHTVYQEMLTVFRDLQEQEARLREMETSMALPDTTEDLLREYGKAQEAFELAGGYDYEVRIKQVLDGLGFESHQRDMPLQHCSGGQKTRALLARLLLEEPDLLILDEPTNHLDIAALEWLENKLRTWEGAMLVVSHDRYFLDKVVGNIWEMSSNGIESYRGNYSAYLQQREERWRRREEEFTATQATFLKELDYVKRNIARDSTTDQAKGRLRRLIRHVKAVEAAGVQALNQNWSQFMRDGPGISGEKWNVASVESHIKALRKPSLRKKRLNMRFQVTKHQAHKVLTSTDLEIGYPNTLLFKADNIELYRGGCAALIGPNGSGKSTFLRTLMGEIEPLGGKLRRGASLQIGYFAQAHDKLNPQNSVIDELISHVPAMLPAQARDYLARFQFKGDDVFKLVSSLSGGERGWLALAILALDEVNFLVLDEPTNHLDIPAQEALQEALQTFQGTILLVTHDRYLIDHLATEIWELHKGQLHIHQGDYASYLIARDRAAEVEKAEKVKQAPSRPSPSRDKEKMAKKMAQELAEIEVRIHELESTLGQLGQDLEDATKNEHWHKIKSLSKAYTAAEVELGELMRQWEMLSLASEA